MPPIIFNPRETEKRHPARLSAQAHRDALVTLSSPLFGTAKGWRVNETNALTMPTLITGPDRPPNRRASARANYAEPPADRANRTVSRESWRHVGIPRFLRTRSRSKRF